MVPRIIKIFLFVCLFAASFCLSAYLALTIFVKSESTVVVPELVGKEVVDTLNLLSDYGLNTKVTGMRYDPHIPKNRIIRQDPGPGSEIKKGRDVRIVVSNGPPNVMIPDIKGLALPAAQAAIDMYELSFGTQALTYHPRIPKGVIISQYPAPGSRTLRSNKIDVLLSMGQRSGLYKMPDITGLLLAEGKKLLARRGFKLTGVIYDHTRMKPKNLISAQKPPAGRPISAKGPVTLTVSSSRNIRQGESVSSDPSLDGALRFIFYRLQNGFLKKRLKMGIIRDGRLTYFLDKFKNPGDMVLLSVSYPENETIFIYEDDALVKVENMH